MKNERKIIFYEHYFQDFYLELPDLVREKIGFVFRLIKTVEQIPVKFLKHIEGSTGLFEIRIDAGNNIYRVFCCFDEGNLVVLFNGFQKKTNKTPANEIKLAENLKKEYFENKKNKDGKK